MVNYGTILMEVGGMYAMMTVWTIFSAQYKMFVNSSALCKYML